MSVHQVKKNKHGSYTRDGLDIEVVAGRNDTYSELLENACAALDMHTCPVLPTSVSWYIRIPFILWTVHWNLGIPTTTGTKICSTCVLV